MKQISKEYAEALFALACETGEEERTMEALDMVALALREEQGSLELFSSPAIALAERLRLIDECFGTRVPEHVVSLMQLMCEKGRIRAFFACVDEYRRLLDVKRAAHVARVSSAVPLDEQQRAALTRKLEQRCGGTVRLECTVDPTLLGGLVVEMEGRVTDGSLRHRLQEIKEVMNG